MDEGEVSDGSGTEGATKRNNSIFTDLYIMELHFNIMHSGIIL